MTQYSGKSQSVIGNTTSLQSINRTDIQFNGSDYPYNIIKGMKNTIHYQGSLIGRISEKKGKMKINS